MHAIQPMFDNLWAESDNRKRSYQDFQEELWLKG
jgi:hypothetical protein